MAVKPKSKSAAQNLDAFKDTWINQVSVMLDAVDDITKVEDFLSSSESHLLEDIKKCLNALQVKKKNASLSSSF